MRHWCRLQRPAGHPGSSPQRRFAYWPRRTNTLQKCPGRSCHPVSPYAVVGVSLKIMPSSGSDWLQASQLQMRAFGGDKFLSHPPISTSVCYPTSTHDAHDKYDTFNWFQAVGLIHFHERILFNAILSSEPLVLVYAMAANTEQLPLVVEFS